MFTLISPLTGKMEAWETPALGDIPTQDALFAVDMEREITSLHIPKKVWAVGKGAPKYRVFKTHTESVTVEAATAVEAIAASGVAHPIKILRGEMDIGNVVANAILGATEECFETSVTLEADAPAEVPKTNGARGNGKASAASK